MVTAGHFPTDAIKGFGQAQLERATGIEPAFSAWEADVLPLNYARVALIVVRFRFLLGVAAATSTIKHG